MSGVKRGANSTAERDLGATKKLKTSHEPDSAAANSSDQFQMNSKKKRKKEQQKSKLPKRAFANLDTTGLSKKERKKLVKQMNRELQEGRGFDDMCDFVLSISLP